MLAGRRLGQAATRFLRYLLPLCMVAATVVAGMGLLRVINRTNEPPLSQTSASLTLGVASRPAARSAAAKVAPTPTVAPSTAPASVTTPVAVFNVSSIRGLASRTAILLRGKGITVDAVDNLLGTQKPTESTVFYAPGQGEQARMLASLIGAAAVEPAPSWIPADGRLVVVVTDTSTLLPSS